MEGPSGSYRPDTGGKRAGQTDGQGVREWQKNTWFGPAPLNSNPFDEPEDAPELKEIRSENVNEHMGEFWQPHNAGYIQYSVNHAAVKNPGQNKTANTKKKQKKRRFPLAVLVFLLTVTVVLAVPGHGKRPHPSGGDYPAQRNSSGRGNPFTGRKEGFKKNFLGLPPAIQVYEPPASAYGDPVRP